MVLGFAKVSMSQLIVEVVIRIFLDVKVGDFLGLEEAAVVAVTWRGIFSVGILIILCLWRVVFNRLVMHSSRVILFRDLMLRVQDLLNVVICSLFMVDRLVFKECGMVGFWLVPLLLGV